MWSVLFDIPDRLSMKARLATGHVGSQVYFTYLMPCASTQTSAIPFMQRTANTSCKLRGSAVLCLLNSVAKFQRPNFANHASNWIALSNLSLQVKDLILLGLVTQNQY